MKKVIIVYNPRSSKHGLVAREVLEKVRGEKGIILGKFEIQPTNPKDNAENLAKIITGGELVVAAGGDGTATISLNGVILARERYKKEAVFTAMPYGNFNDMPRLFGNLDIREALLKFREGKQEDVYPVETRVNKKHFWYFLTYFTVGMMAESTRVFEDKKTREKLKTGKKGMFFSGKTLFFWYLKNKRRKFLPAEIVVNSTTFRGVTDYVATNGGTLARVVKIPRSSGGKDYFKEEKKFYSGAERFVGLFRMLRLGFFRGVLRKKLPGKETEGDSIQFKKPAEVFLHVGGEGEKVRDVSLIEVNKLEKPIKVIRIERRKNEGK